jgi:hypothetical protein
MVMGQDGYVPLPGTYREADDSAVEFADALIAWTAVARPALERTAKKYQAIITYNELAKEVQSRTGIRTRSLMMNWIGQVLGRVSHECHRRGEPLLSSLCVREDHTVGPGYGLAVVENFGGEPPEDLDQHAAAERLKCYRYFQALDLPADDGVATLAPKVAARRRRERAVRSSLSEDSRRVCPNCHLLLPLTGQCDACG